MLNTDDVAPGIRGSDALRLGYIRRWGMVSTVREQDVASHSCRVALIALFLLEEIIKHYGPSDRLMRSARYVRATAMAMAIVHDLDEVFSADIPSPFKKWAGEKVDPIPRPFDMESLFSNADAFDEYQLCRKLVHWADAVEAWVFISENAHTPHGLAVRDKISLTNAHQSLADYLVDEDWVGVKDDLSARVIFANKLENFAFSLRHVNFTTINETNWAGV